MPLWNCTYQSCSRPAERERGSCTICSGHFCIEHLLPTFHRCPSEFSAKQETQPDEYDSAYAAAKDSHLLKLLEKINIEALVALASKLRHNLPCTVPQFGADTDQAARVRALSSQMGGQNCHLEIRFADGEIWLARIRRHDAASPPKPVRQHILVSEFATLKFLEGVNIPTPRVFHGAVESAPENHVGVSYLLTQKMRGSALDWDAATKEQRTKVLEQLTDVFLELEKHPFDATGSLISEGEIGGFAQSLLFQSPTSPLGPFQSFRSSLESMVRHHLALISHGEISSLDVDNYLSFCWRLDMIPDLLSSADDDAGPFFLKHMDDKGNHILVDDDYNITGIIDWEFASTEVRQVAFASPCMLWPVGDFYDGKNALAPEELELASMFQQRGRTDMAMNVLGGRALQRFLFFLGGASNDQAEFEALFQGLRRATLDSSDADSQALATIEPYQEWRKLALPHYSKNHPWLQKHLDMS